MPLWDIHTPPGALSPQEKQHIAKSLTPIYSSAGIPPFYVRVRFQEYDPVNVYSGGESDDKIILIEILHLARTMPTDEVKEGFLKAVDRVLTPIFEAKGFDWEYNVTEAPRELWKINGMKPPRPGTEAEKAWFAANRPLKEKL